MRARTVALSSTILGLITLTAVAIYDPSESKTSAAAPDINILIEGAITDDEGHRNPSVVAAKKLLRDPAVKGHINVQVETPGGSLLECIILSQLFKSRAVTVTSNAVASSCGALLLVSGANARMEPDTAILIHLARHYTNEGEIVIDYDAVQTMWVKLLADKYAVFLTDMEIKDIVSGLDVILYGKDMLERAQRGYTEATQVFYKLYALEKKKYDKLAAAEKLLKIRMKNFMLKKANEQIDQMESGEPAR